MKKLLTTVLLYTAFAFINNVATVQAQIMKASDLEKYAKERYGEKWLDAAKNLAENICLSSNIAPQILKREFS